MAEGFTARGTRGAVVHGHHVAARIRDWSLRSHATTLDGIRTVITLDIDTVDEFWGARRPLRLLLWVGTTVWSWDSISLEITGSGSHVCRVDALPDTYTAEQRTGALWVSFDS